MQPLNKLYDCPGGGFMFPAINTATTRAYTAIIPDMTTGMSDCIACQMLSQRSFIVIVIPS